MQCLDFVLVLGSKFCCECELVLVMVVVCIVVLYIKLVIMCWWYMSMFVLDFGVVEVIEDDLYVVMDWLFVCQDVIQKKFVVCYLSKGGLVLYDLSLSYFEGIICLLVKLGYSCDGCKGMLQVNYGLFIDVCGCFVVVLVYEGNVVDSVIFMFEVWWLCE